MRLVRELWEPPDPWDVAGLVRQLPPLAVRRCQEGDETLTAGSGEQGKAMLDESAATWTAWRKSVSVGGFCLTG